MPARKDARGCLIANRRLGRYTVHECLDRGGMGEVWRASVDGPGGFMKPVVLKTVRADLAARRDLVDMLIREAALAARLSHPNIVTVFDLDCIDGTYFFAMEYVPGHTLAAVLRQAQLRRSGLPAWFVASVVAACCDGLHYAHDLADEHGHPLGLVHRDVSLANVMIAATGNVTILDFGIATAAVAGVGVLQDRDFLMGKFQYLPPEIVRGDAGDRRTDVYGLGVVLLIGLTGAMPYTARDDADLLRQIVDGPPRDLARRLAAVPRRLAKIIARAMAHDVAARTPDVATLGAELREVLRDLGHHPTADDVARHVAGLFAPDAPPLLAEGTDSGPVIEIDLADLDVVDDAASSRSRAPTVPAIASRTPLPRVAATPAASLPALGPAAVAAAAAAAADADAPAVPSVITSDPFTTVRPIRTGAGIFDGWSRREEPRPADDAPLPARRGWPW